ncbi:hypothetical protein [Mesorhizobium sp. CN2-181]|uniref:hypothetical protein n=1 Tax=Mesorhizobium yinganensis TaxID=3157707 RepID=UPI0032B74F68
MRIIKSIDLSTYAAYFTLEKFIPSGTYTGDETGYIVEYDDGGREWFLQSHYTPWMIPSEGIVIHTRSTPESVELAGDGAINPWGGPL